MRNFETNHTMHIIPFFFSSLFVLMLLFPGFVFSQEESTGEDLEFTLFKNLQRDTILKLSLETDLKTMVRKKYDEQWQETKIKFNGPNSEALEWEAKLRTRGNVRKRVCYYPPIKIKLKKKWLLSKEMNPGFNDLKIVVGCKKGSLYSNLILKEYLVYKLYEELTDYSFKTQLAEIEFIDSHEKWKPYTTYAFLIENEDEMARRLNGKCARPKRLLSKYFYADQLDKMTLFEFMIGNTDWSAHTSHNVRILKSQDYPLPLPIAYDFDYAGLVNAPYAVHGDGISLDNITDRLYLGICRKPGELEKQIPLFQEKKEAFYRIVNNFHYLPEKERKSMIHYLDEFYAVIGSSKSFKRNILDVCRPNGR